MPRASEQESSEDAELGRYSLWTRPPTGWQLPFDRKALEEGLKEKLGKPKRRSKEDQRQIAPYHTAVTADVMNQPTAE